MAYASGATHYTNKDQLVDFMDRAFNPELRYNVATEDQIESQKEREKLSKTFQDDWGGEQQV